MAKQPKLFDKIDAKVEGREGLKTVWQAGKFRLFSVARFSATRLWLRRR